MLVEKIEKILKGSVPEDKLTELVSAVETLYYKYENGQAKLAVDEQKRELKRMLEPFVEKYGADMLNKFYSYWTATNKNGKKCLYKMQPVFDLKKRLNTWAGNNKNRSLEDKLKNNKNWLSQ